jgi:hypothetical protein
LAYGSGGYCVASDDEHIVAGMCVGVSSSPH